MNKFTFHGCILLTGLLFSSTSLVANESTIQAGAKAFKQDCAQCHGTLGLGDGYVSNLKQRFGNTNLTENKNKKDKASLTRSLQSVSHKAYPEFPTLNKLQVNTLVDFLELFYAKTSDAIKVLNSTHLKRLPNFALGQTVYERRCLICHGKEGDGKGRLAKIIRTPSPFDLRESYISKGLLRQIIEQGSAIQGRSLSDKMPGFKGEMSEHELQSVMLYVRDFLIYKSE